MELLKSERNIISSWKKCYENPTVSICCVAFNHEKYISDALNGFLEQITNFPFEILVYDDASNDRTADIIRAYQLRFPRIIKPIFQRTNQYCKNKNINPHFNFRRAKGKFIAICEGDDYWIEKNKLQKQVEIMKGQPDIHISFHPSYCVNIDKLQKHNKYSHHAEQIKMFTAEEVLLSGGAFMPTASIMITQTAKRKLLNFFDKYSAPVGDWYIQGIASFKHGAIYIPDCMSVYRINVPGSATNRELLMNEGDILERAKKYKSCILGLEEIGFSKDILKRLYAIQMTEISVRLLKIRKFENSKYYLQKSCDLFYGVNNNQKLLRNLRYLNRIIWLLWWIKKSYKKLKAVINCTLVKRLRTERK